MMTDRRLFLRTPLRRVSTLAALIFAAAGIACDGSRGGEPTPRGDTADGANSVSMASHPTTVVDSILPPEEEIRRFLETIPTPATELEGGETDRDALVARFIRAVEAADTLDLARMAMSRAEFGYLYYPTSRYVERPYQLSPALVWYQNQNVGGRGLTRLLRRYGGVEMGFVSYRCPDEPEVEGENRFWHGCSVQHQFEGDTVDIRLFGSIWERGGRYKLVGYANAF